MKILYITILAVYMISLFFIFLYSLIQLHLVIKYRKAKKKEKKSPLRIENIEDKDLPIVTVQLPVFNELYVVERLIETVAKFDYPKDKLEIQVLDDSTDESFEIAAAKVEEIKQLGIDIQHIKRPVREGYKAGALQYGLQTAKGKYITIFDADFLPNPDFLRKTIPSFNDDKIGMVQTRWGHINEDYSIVTKAQAFQLNAHFTVEQKGRNSSGYFMNFNGTAGVWRRTAIEDAGGWQSDTITEDLDLSYRCQLAGWKFKYLEDVVAPAELPAVMSAVKSQQYRWTKGGAETARKHWLNILRSKFSFKERFHGLAHLLNSSIFIFVLLTGLFSIPALWAKQQLPELNFYFNLGSVFFIAFMILILFYATSLSVRKGTGKDKFKYFIGMFPTFLCLSMGLALHNSVAVIKGYMGQQSPFIRTPKFNIKKLSDNWDGNKYISSKIEFITIVEGLLILYFIFGLVYGIVTGDIGFLPFHIMLIIGYGLVFFYSIKQTKVKAAD